MCVVVFQSRIQSQTYTMSSSNNKDTLITAVAAAAAGAAICYTAMKLNDKTKQSSNSSNSTDPSEGRGPKKSMIIDGGLTQDSRADSGILFPHNHEEKMRRRIATRVTVEEENMTPRQSVTVRVPATSANVGPGCEFFSDVFI